MSQACKNCRFFREITDYSTPKRKDIIGECRRYPPQAVYQETIINETNWRFPVVGEFHHCGEWRSILESGNISVYDDK